MTGASQVPEVRDGAGPTNKVSTRFEELGLSWWDITVLFATVVLAVVVPLEVVFKTLDAPWLVIVSAVITVVLATDIRRRLSGDRSRYLRGWFTVDLLAAFPFDLLAELPGIEGTSAGSLIRFVGLLRVLRIARVLVLQRRWRVGTSFNPALLRLAFFGFWIALVGHWIACGWISLDGFESGPSDLAPYQSSLYWTITTLTTVGFGDITPIGPGQTYYTMVTMALGAAMYGYIIGNVASLLANIDVLRSRHLTRIETINHFMRDRHVPRDLQARVRDYYNYLWETRMDRQTEMLEDLPKPLHIEIALHLNRNILQKVPLFEGASEDFFRELVLYLKPMVFLPGQMLMRRGEVGHQLYFINRGSVEVLSRDDSEVLAVLSDGDFVGEMALLSSQPRANTVTALEYCNVYALDREGFDLVLDGFPEVSAEVHRIAEERRMAATPDA
jgi:voltage-gated potassium channel